MFATSSVYSAFRMIISYPRPINESHSIGLQFMFVLNNLVVRLCLSFSPHCCVEHVEYGCRLVGCKSIHEIVGNINTLTFRALQDTAPPAVCKSKPIRRRSCTLPDDPMRSRE